MQPSAKVGQLNAVDDQERQHAVGARHAGMQTIVYSFTQFQRELKVVLA